MLLVCHVLGLLELTHLLPLPAARSKSGSGSGSKSGSGSGSKSGSGSSLGLDLGLNLGLDMGLNLGLDLGLVGLGLVVNLNTQEDPMQIHGIIST